MACGERKTEGRSERPILLLPASPASTDSPSSLSAARPGPPPLHASSFLPPAGGARDARRGRAALLLSLTVLVWYGGVTAGRFPGAAPEALPGRCAEVAAAGPAEAGDVPAAAAPGAGGRPLTVRQKYLLGRRIDINRADFREISELPGITDQTAREVVELRNRLGGFSRPDDLLAVRGIKEKRLKKILPFLAGFANN